VGEGLVPANRAGSGFGSAAALEFGCGVRMKTARLACFAPELIDILSMANTDAVSNEAAA
jgi:hypothetical protein